MGCLGMPVNIEYGFKSSIVVSWRNEINCDKIYARILKRLPSDPNLET